MKITKMLVCAAACLFVSGMLLAEEGPKGEGKGKGPGDRGQEEIRQNVRSVCLLPSS